MTIISDSFSGDRLMVLDQLSTIERHLSSGLKLVEKQRKLVGDLEANGFDAHAARDMLRKLQETQLLHLADRERLLAELRH